MIARALSCGLALASLLALTGAAPAAAQWGRPSDDQRALQHYEIGERHYNEGSYEEAISQWLAAYRLSPRPLILFNIANAYERLGRYEEAIDALERYRAEAPPEEHAQLDARLTHLRERARGGGGGGGDLLVPGIVVGAVGVATIAAGIVFGALALDARDRLQDPAGGACRASGDRLVCGGDAGGLFSDAETFALAADIGLIGGGVVLATGLLLVILDLASGPDASPAAALAPRLAVGRGGASAGIVGRF